MTGITSSSVRSLVSQNIQPAIFAAVGNRLIIAMVAALFLVFFAPLVTRAQNGDLPQPFLPAQVHPVSTVPPNGDVNPYGVAFVPRQFPTGAVNPGDILVSNFNNHLNLQGTGTTIVDVPAGDRWFGERLLSRQWIAGPHHRSEYSAQGIRSGGEFSVARRNLW